MVGCGLGSDEALEAPRDAAATQAETLACAQQELTAPAGTCGGPWQVNQYVNPCYRYAPHRACGVSVPGTSPCITGYERCRAQGFGVETHVAKSRIVKAWTTASYSGPVVVHNSWQQVGYQSCSAPANPATGVTDSGGTSSLTTYCSTMGGLELQVEKLMRGDNLPTYPANADPWDGGGVLTSRSCNTCFTPAGCYASSGYSATKLAAYGGTLAVASNYDMCDITVTRWKADARPPCNPIAGTCPDPSKDSFYSCRTSGNGADTAGACGTTGARVLTGYGLPRPVKPTDSDPSRIAELQPVCLTADDLAGTMEKYDRLKQTYDNVDALASDATARQALRDITVKKLKLLLELKGHEISDPSAIDFIFGLYTAHPDAQSTCGENWSPPGARHAPLDASLQACQRALVYPSTDELNASAAKVRDYCVDAGQAVALPSSDPDRAAYLTKFTEVMLPYLTKVQSVELAAVGDAAVNTELQKRLQIVGKWYGYVRDGYYSNPPDIWSDVSRVVAATWKGAYRTEYKRLEAVGSVPPPGGATSADLKLFGVASLARDREMLRALFSDYTNGEPPLTTVPALLFIADALKAIEERLGAISPYHDFACSYMRCENGLQKTEMYEMYRLIANLDDADSFSAALAEAKAAHLTDSRLFSSNWTNAYAPLWTKIDSGLAKVVPSAVLDLGFPEPYEPAMVREYSPRVLAPLAGFASVLREARTRADNYLGVGQFASRPRSLPTAVLSSQLAVGEANFRDAAASLASAIQVYRSEQAGHVRDLIGQIANGQEAADLQTRKQELENRLEDLHNDLRGVNTAARMDEHRFADVGSRLEALTTSLRDVNIGSTPIGPISFRGRDGRFAALNVGDIRSVAKMDVPAAPVPPGSPALPEGVVVRVQPGAVLVFRPTGTYQPTCALTDPNRCLGVPTGRLLVTDVNPEYDFDDRRLKAPGWIDFKPLCGMGDQLHSVESGSMGFTWSMAGSAQTAGMVNETFTVENEFSVKSCGGGGFMIGSAEVCGRYSESRSDSETDQKRWDSTFSASFSQGLRLDNTPFPQYPVGAVLAVLVKPDGYRVPEEVIDIAVVQQPEGSIAVSKEADLYLVVNDRQCTTAATDKELGVSITWMKPASDVARQIASAMERIGGHFDEFEAEIIDQGQLLSTQASDLKSYAWNTLETECGHCHPAALPSLLRGFFESWVEKEIRGIERAVLRRALQRQIRDAALQETAIVQDLDAYAQKGRYVDLLPRLSIRNLEYENKRLADALANLLVQSAIVAPTVYLWYPEVLQEPIQRTRGLLALDWVSVELGGSNSASSPDPTTLAGAVNLAVTEILGKLAAAHGETGNTVIMPVVVRFPNPRHATQHGPVPPPPVPAGVQDPIRLYQIWDALVAGRHAWSTGAVGPQIVFDLRPTDIYDSGPADGKLHCSIMSPTIRRMAFYLATRSESKGVWNGQGGTHPAGTVSSYMTFAGPFGLELFDFRNADFRETPQFKPYFGLQSDWWHTYTEYKTRDADLLALSAMGVSPFALFKINSLGYYGDPAWRPDVDPNPFLYSEPLDDRTTEFFVVMEVEGRRYGPWVTGVPSCER